MNNLKAIKRENTTAGEINKIRSQGFIPAILYGGKDSNTKISVDKKSLSTILNSDSFLSTVVELDIEGKKQKVLPREVAYHVVSDEPIHIDFMRIIPGTKIIIEIPVQFKNHSDSPGLKRGGVLPDDIIIDLAGLDIGASIKISTVNLPNDVTPTIIGRDFVIATVAAPTIVKEPEKPAEETTEGADGEAPAEGAEATAKDGDPAKKDEKGKEAAAGDKKPTEKKPDDKKPAEKKPAEKK